MQPSDDPGHGAAGAGVSPSDPGASGSDQRRAAGGVADAAGDHDDPDDVVQAVEDLVRDLLPEGDGRG